MNQKYQAVANRLAKGLEPYVNIYRLPLELKPTPLQHAEMNGEVPFDQNNYHNPAFEELVKSVNQHNNDFL
jgi:hypothetical protein